jgi:hypothetical protein
VQHLGVAHGIGPPTARLAARSYGRRTAIGRKDRVRASLNASNRYAPMDAAIGSTHQAVRQRRCCAITDKNHRRSRSRRAVGDPSRLMVN